MKKETVSTIIVAIVVAIFVIVGTGLWGANVYKLATSDFSQITGMIVVRVIGVFVAPVGVICGAL